MITVTQSETDKCCLSVTEEMSIYNAAAFYDELKQYIDKYNTVELDLSQVNELDTSCFQVLLRSKLISQKENKNFQIVSHSDESKEIIDLLNVSSLFEH